MKRLIITGGCGFVGSNLASYFAERGFDVVAVDNLVRRGSEWNAVRLADLGIRVETMSASEFSTKQSEFENAVVLHCAAQPSAVTGFADPRHDFEENTKTTFDILETCRHTGAGMIYWSTNKVFSADVINPASSIIGPTQSVDGGNRSIYGVTKLCGDLLCQEYATAYNLPIVVNRFSCLAGPWQFGKTEQGWVSWFVLAGLLRHKVNLIGWEGRQVRDVLFAPDICRLIELQVAQLESHRGSPRVFTAGGGQDNAVSLRCYLDLLREMGIVVRYDVVTVPRAADHRYYVSDISALYRDYGWLPELTIRQGTEQIVKWAESNLDTLRSIVGEAA